MIDNAVKYSPVNKEIQVTIKALEDEMLVQVQDNGEGISKEDINHIFERFYQGSKKEGSTGLGLAIADSICRLQHLNIRYYFEQEEHCFEILK